MFFWNSLAFSVIQRMLAIWSLVPLPFLKPTWTSGSSQFTYCWSLAWRFLSITLLACEILGNKFFKSFFKSTNLLIDFKSDGIKSLVLSETKGSWFFFCFFVFVFMAELCSLWNLTLVPWPGIEPVPSSMKVQGPHHRTTREFTGGLYPLCSIISPCLLDRKSKGLCWNIYSLGHTCAGTRTWAWNAILRLSWLLLFHSKSYSCSNLSRVFYRLRLLQCFSGCLPLLCTVQERWGEHG